ncbi:MAG: magnesium transporter CorA family protein, partial [Bacteroidota bacterium]
MLRVYRTINDELQIIEDLCQKGAWISLVDPSESELEAVQAATGVDPDYLRAPLDEEERSRIEAGDGQILILINIPYVQDGQAKVLYDTMPFGIIINANSFITVCLRHNPLLAELAEARPRIHYTQKRTRFLLQTLFRTAGLYLRYLRQIDRLSDEIEESLHKSLKNEELIRLLNLEKSLVYFNTSLRSNEIVMEKLLRSRL